MQVDTKLINRTLEIVRDGLRNGDIPAEQFDMNRYGPPCRTPACIWGWTSAALRKAGFPEYEQIPHFGLSTNLWALFHPNLPPGERSNISPSKAADAIDRYLAGKAPWPRAA